MTFPEQIQSFSKRYAVLNLDWMPLFIDAVKDTPQRPGIHHPVERSCAPVVSSSLDHLYRSCLQSCQCEVQNNTPFARLIAPFSVPENGLSEGRIDPRLRVDGEDIVLRKTRWSATMGNSLEQTLRAQGIDTVVIVCDVCISRGLLA